MLEPIIEVRNLNLVYDIGTPSETVALKNVNLKIYPHEYVVFFGPSGCGKSTLLYCIAGLLTPTSGSIFVNGKDIVKSSQKDLSVMHRKDIGIVFQAYNLISTISILDNVALPQTWRGVPKNIREPIAQKLLSKFGLEAQTHRLPQEMSGGQQQRAAIARALVNDAPVILADEPVGNLDSRAANTVLEILSDLNGTEKKTILLVTHDASLFGYADRIIFFKDGELIKEERNPNKAPAIALDEKEVENMKHKRNFDFADALSDYFLNVNELYLKESLIKLIAQRIENKISNVSFEEILKKPFRDGGIGLDKERIDGLKRRISLIVYEAELLKKKTEKELKYSPLSLEIGELRKYVLEDTDRKLSFLQIKRLEEAIGSFIRGSIDGDQFKKIIALSEIQGGLGMSAGNAHEFLEKLEMVMKLR